MRKLDRRSTLGGLTTLALGGLVPQALFGQDQPAGGPGGPPPGWGKASGDGAGRRPPPPKQAPYVFEEAHAADGSSCVLIPEETAGPYPVDLHSNGKIWRSDIREDRVGIPLDLELHLTDVRAACSPLEGARVDLWQCDKEGLYSAVQNLALVPGARHDDMRDKTFLRGIQRADASGRVRFMTIFPGWYPSRLTHIHFQIYLPDGRVATSQIAFPETLTHAVYDSPLYRDHGQNTVITSMARDNVFGDDMAKYQMAAMSGDLTSGFKGRLDVSVAAS